MEMWLSILPIIIYVLLIILLIIGIILGIKTIITMNKVEKVVDNVNEKMEALNPLFNIIDFTTDKLASITDSVVDFFTGIFGRFITRKTKRKDEDDE